MKQANGFTVIELLVAVVLAAIVTSSAMALYITQHKQLIVQDQVSDMQASLRAGSAELVKQIRMAGYNNPMGIPAITAYNTNPDSILIVYECEDLRNALLEWDMPRPSSELRCDGHDLSALYDQDWAYIYDPVTKTGEMFYVSHVQYSSSNVQHNTMTLSKAYKKGCIIYKMNRLKYYIDRTDPNHPNLMVQIGGRTPQIYAENITNLNLQYVLSSGAIVDVPAVQDMIREVIIQVDARTDRTDQEFQSQYRTRTLATRVRVRNLGVN